MPSYEVVLNGKKSRVKAASWYSAFRLVMVGHSSVPRNLIVRPCKKKKPIIFEQCLPKLLKKQAGLFN